MSDISITIENTVDSELAQKQNSDSEQQPMKNNFQQDTGFCTFFNNEWIQIIFGIMVIIALIVVSIVLVKNNSFDSSIILEKDDAIQRNLQETYDSVHCTFKVGIPTTLRIIDWTKRHANGAEACRTQCSSTNYKGATYRKSDTRCYCLETGNQIHEFEDGNESDYETCDYNDNYCVVKSKQPDDFDNGMWNLRVWGPSMTPDKCHKHASRIHSHVWYLRQGSDVRYCYVPYEGLQNLNDLRMPKLVNSNYGSQVGGDCN